MGIISLPPEKQKPRPGYPERGADHIRFLNGPGVIILSLPAAWAVEQPVRIQAVLGQPE